MKKLDEHLNRYILAISKSKKTIYDRIDIGDSTLWIPTPELEQILNIKLNGLSLKGLPLRTRSKVIKQEICNALGYPTPSSFKKTQPRFVGQNFDTYSQKSNNLQIWNEEIDPTRRYVFLRISDDDILTKVKVVTGEDLTVLDTTGTLTQKYQAKLTIKSTFCELVSQRDTENLLDIVQNLNTSIPSTIQPTDYPCTELLIPISELFIKLTPLIGSSISYLSSIQERNRGQVLHEKVCESLGYSNYKDDGRFPDIRNQLLEVKLQTSPTIDLGLVCPDSTLPLDVPMVKDRQMRHCDVRYAIFYGKVNNETVQITNFYLSTGQDFFKRFNKFQGKVLNKKIQIPLPSNFFDI